MSFTASYLEIMQFVAYPLTMILFAFPVLMIVIVVSTLWTK